MCTLHNGLAKKKKIEHDFRLTLHCLHYQRANIEMTKLTEIASSLFRMDKQTISIWIMLL